MNKEYKYDISLVIPAYNEEESISRAIDTADQYLKTVAREYEIIIVNDGSTDRTAIIIDYYASLNSRVIALHNSKNEGSGRSLYIGFKKAKFEYVVSNFADLPFNFDDLNSVMLLFIDSAVDFIIVVRRNRRANSFFRKVTSIVNYWFIRIIFNISVSDFQFIQVYRKYVLDAVRANSRGTFVPAEIIISAVHKGYRFREYVTDFHPRFAGEAKCGRLRIVMQSIYEILIFWFNWFILRRCRHENSLC